VRSWLPLAAGAALLLALVAHRFAPLWPCPATCVPDYDALYGESLGRLALSDARLNSWILAWDQHALGSAPGSLFDANIFHPMPNALAGSEHLLGVSVLLGPLRLVTDEAVALHGGAIALSSLLLAAATWALVHGLTRSHFAGIAAAATALLMPWRIYELAHVQLLSAHWFPLVWLFAGRLARGEGGRRDVAALAAALSLQLLSSFYLAYFLALSLAVLVPVLLLRTGAWRAALPRLAGAVAVGVVVLLPLSIPYLRWQSGGGFVPLAPVFESVSLAEGWAAVAPAWELGPRTQVAPSAPFEVPLGVLLLALLALAWLGGGRGRDERAARAGDFALGLALVCAAAFVLMLGREIQVGGARVPLPGALAAELVPGFENLRNPKRWGVVIGVATPALAGLGIARLEAWTRGAARHGARAAAAAGLLLTLPLPQVPARDGWEDRDDRMPGYRALAELPPGPVVEIPWPLQPQHDILRASAYMLGSTVHWKPLTNGTSGYAPPSYPLVRLVAQGLPDPDALARLHSLARVRYALVHGDALYPPAREAWLAAERAGAVRAVYRDAHTRIYELPGWREAGRFTEALVSAGPRPRTFAGLSREPLRLPANAGRLSAEPPEAFLRVGALALPSLVPVVIENASDVPWPGFDVRTEGLVQVRATFAREDGSVAHEEAARLVVDVPAGATVETTAPVSGPVRDGRYRLRLELVQEVQGALRPLPVPAVEARVAVRPMNAVGAVAAPHEEGR